MPDQKAIIKKTVFLIDGSGFLYRAYYGVRPLHTSKGIPVQAVYSFCRMIKKLIKRFNPHYVALVWDSKGKTERHELYAQYKAKREAPPSDIFLQKELIQQFADIIHLAQVAKEGIEADDLIFSLARDYAQQGAEVVIITADKDLSQAIQQDVIVFDPFKDLFIDAPTFEKEMGFPVEKLPFYFALVGDSSDNIPGVKGIGKKGATDLISQFNSLQDLYDRIDQVKRDRIKELLLEQKDNAFLSQKLFLARYYQLNIPMAALVFSLDNWQLARDFFKELDFVTLVAELGPQEPYEPAELAKKYSFKTIISRAELQEISHKIQQAKVVAVDTELTTIDPFKGKLVGISLCYQIGQAYYIPFGHDTDEEQLSFKEVFELVSPILADPAVAKIMHHAKYDCVALSASGFQVNNVAFDTMIAAHLVTQDWQSIGLKELSKAYLQEHMLTYKDVVTDKKLKNFAHVPLLLATEYAAADAHQTFQLYEILKKDLHKDGVEDLYYTIELPLVPVLASMQAEGVYVDSQVLAQLDKEVTQALQVIKEEILGLLGPAYKDINLNSPLQLKILLFQELQLPPQKKSKKGQYSTDVEVLKELAKLHPVPGLIMRYRELFKLKSTYIDALPRFISYRTGRVHSHFSQTAVATGRLASSEPNLQNIPVIGHYASYVRSAFKANQGHLFLSTDYSQIELRVLAYLSQDERLLESYKHDIDIHRQTAAGLFNVPLDQVTNEQRQIGKRINFSILYGVTPFGLSQDLEIPLSQAKEYIESYFAHYPRVQTWIEEVIEDTKKQGFVTTLWGRRRPLPAIYETNKVLYAEARRIAINTRAQGTAAEIMKKGMIDLYKVFTATKPESKIILQIHDELLISVPEKEINELQQIVTTVLESVVDWNVPLRVTTRIGTTWAEVTK